MSPRIRNFFCFVLKVGKMKSIQAVRLIQVLRHHNMGARLLSAVNVELKRHHFELNVRRTDVNSDRKRGGGRAQREYTVLMR